MIPVLFFTRAESHSCCDEALKSIQTEVVCPYCSEDHLLAKHPMNQTVTLNPLKAAPLTVGQTGAIINMESCMQLLGSLLHLHKRHNCHHHSLRCFTELLLQLIKKSSDLHTHLQFASRANRSCDDVINMPLLHSLHLDSRASYAGILFVNFSSVPIHPRTLVSKQTCIACFHL